MRRVVWLTGTRVAGWFGVPPQTLHVLRTRIWKLRAFDEKLAASIIIVPPLQRPRRTHRRVVHVIGSLSAGGAERQLVYLARETARRGDFDVRILTTNPIVGANAHYLPLAVEGGVSVETASGSLDPTTAQVARLDHDLAHRISALDPAYRQQVHELTLEFLRLEPDVVHTWLDHANIWGAIAAFNAGVPSIVISTRNVNPSNFPMIDAPYFLPWYRLLAGSSRVQIIGNSQVGAHDYADWIGVARSRITVIPNGFDSSAMRALSPEEKSLLRDELQLENKQVVLGIFRLAEEKNPTDFARVAAEVLLTNPRACVLVAGDGPMRSKLQSLARRIDPRRFRLLGRRRDVASLISLADVVLHTSRAEGTPNALLEAQALGCPIVATNGGGTRDAIEHEGSGFLCEVGDTDELARRTIQILHDPALRARMSARATEFVRTTFALDRMVDRSIACYAQAERS